MGVELENRITTKAKKRGITEHSESRDWAMKIEEAGTIAR
jgi:hypothetical protein